MRQVTKFWFVGLTSGIVAFFSCFLLVELSIFEKLFLSYFCGVIVYCLVFYFLTQLFAKDFEYHIIGVEDRDSFGEIKVPRTIVKLTSNSKKNFYLEAFAFALDITFFTITAPVTLLITLGFIYLISPIIHWVFTGCFILFMGATSIVMSAFTPSQNMEDMESFDEARESHYQLININHNNGSEPDWDEYPMDRPVRAGDYIQFNITFQPSKKERSYQINKYHEEYHFTPVCSLIIERNDGITINKDTVAKIYNTTFRTFNTPEKRLVYQKRVLSKSYDFVLDGKVKGTLQTSAISNSADLPVEHVCLGMLEVRPL